MQRKKIRVVFGIAQGVSQFKEYTIGQDEGAPPLAVGRNRTLMGGIIRIEQGQKMETVGKNLPHDFLGWPLT